MCNLPHSTSTKLTAVFMCGAKDVLRKALLLLLCVVHLARVSSMATAHYVSRGVIQRLAIFRVSAAVQPGEDTEILRESSKLSYGAVLRLY